MNTQTNENSISNKVAFLSGAMFTVVIHIFTEGITSHEWNLLLGYGISGLIWVVLNTGYTWLRNRRKR